MQRCPSVQIDTQQKLFTAKIIYILQFLSTVHRTQKKLLEALHRQDHIYTSIPVNSAPHSDFFPSPTSLLRCFFFCKQSATLINQKISTQFLPFGLTVHLSNLPLDSVFTNVTHAHTLSWLSVASHAPKQAHLDIAICFSIMTNNGQPEEQRAA